MLKIRWKSFTFQDAPQAEKKSSCCFPNVAQKLLKILYWQGNFSIKSQSFSFATTNQHFWKNTTRNPSIENRLVFVAYFTSDTKRGWSVWIALLAPRMSTRPLGWRFQPIFTSEGPKTPNESIFFQKNQFPLWYEFIYFSTIQTSYTKGETDLSLKRTVK